MTPRRLRPTSPPRGWTPEPLTAPSAQGGPAPVAEATGVSRYQGACLQRAAPGRTATSTNLQHGLCPPSS
jgi:hypothetical protein